MSESMKKTLPPAERCVICEQTLDEVGGGKRIIAQQLRGLCLADRPQGGGNPDYPRKSVPLGDGTGRYLMVWGEPEKWTDESIERARQTYVDNQRPWLCQRCAERTCSECGAPINYPMGSDILHGNGCSTHAAIFPFDPGCTNRQCRKYRDWEV